jgi:hypothetical protein
LFIRFDRFDLIIEAKRWENDQQYFEQWENEFIGYKNEYGEEKKDVYLLAIGGISKEDAEEIYIENYGSITVVKCRWYNILSSLVNTLDILENCDFLEIQSIVRSINIIITSLEMHGFMKINWLESMANFYQVDYEDNIYVLNNWRFY